MLGMPRMTLTMLLASHRSARAPETRIRAQMSPSSVDSASDPAVTRSVSHSPCSRIGRNSRVSATNLAIAAYGLFRRRRAARVSRGFAGGTSSLIGAGARSVEAPFRQDLADGAILPELL